MATVYRARDEVLARSVAVKVLLPELADDSAFLERFRREALAAARLTHPNIVSIFDTGEEPVGEGETWHYIVMEFCPAGTLADEVRRGPVRGDRVRDIAAQMSEALCYAHDNGVIHRDLKPENVLIGEDGTVKVADFGIAKAAFSGRDLTTTGSILGTVAYLSPEQGKGEEPDARSDIYSFGAVLYELLTGRPPFRGETPLATALKHIHEAPAPPLSVRAGVPRDLDALVMRCLAKDPDDRPASAQEIRSALGATSQIRIAPAAKPAPVPVAPGTGGDARWVIKVVAAIAVIVALVVAATWYLGPEKSTRTPGRGGEAGERQITVESADDFDPDGDGSEHPTTVGLTFDRDPATVWTTENYADPLPVMKSGGGVGVLFDLGSSTPVARVQVITTTPGIDVELLAGDSTPTSASDLDVISSQDDVETTFTLDGADTEARFWLLWVTQLPNNGTGEASVAEVRFFGG